MLVPVTMAQEPGARGGCPSRSRGELALKELDHPCMYSYVKLYIFSGNPFGGSLVQMSVEQVIKAMHCHKVQNHG